MKNVVEAFASTRHIAVIGASRSKSKFGAYVCRSLAGSGRTVYPVNPYADTIEGIKAYRTVSQLPDSVESAVFVVKPEEAVEPTKQALEKGITRLWYQQGADFSRAIQLCTAAGVEPVTGKCILMYAAPVSGIHKVHRLIWRLVGKL